MQFLPCRENVCLELQFTKVSLLCCSTVVSSRMCHHLAMGTFEFSSKPHHCDLGSTSVMTLIYTMYNDAEGAAREVLLWKLLHWSLLAESLQYGIDVVEGLVNFGSYLRTCEHNFTRNEDE